MEAGIHELTAGYALDALDPDERAAYEAHLEGCERCREELGSLWQTTESLAVAASGPEPSPALRERILAEAKAESQVVVPFERSRGRRLAPALGAVAAVAAVVAVAVGLWAAQVSGELDDARSALAAPGSRTVVLQEGAGRLVVGSDGQAVLVLDELDPAPRGKTYQAWIVAPGEDPASAGVFPGSEGVDVVGLVGTVDTGEIVAVTIEQEGGAEAPTSEPIAGSPPV